MVGESATVAEVSWEHPQAGKNGLWGERRGEQELVVLNTEGPGGGPCVPGPPLQRGEWPSRRAVSPPELMSCLIAK